jgi:hypothetical protein
MVKAVAISPEAVVFIIDKGLVRLNLAFAPGKLVVVIDNSWLFD